MSDFCSAVATGETSANLSSSAFSDSDGGDTHSASQWQVAASADSSFASPVFDTGTDTSNLVSRAITGLFAETTYIARVRHRDDSGDASTEWSEWSAASSSFTTEAPAATAPTPPTGCAAAALSAGVNRVSWTDASSDESAFVVERAPNSGGSPGAWAEIADDVSPNVEQFDDATAAPGQLYWYRVKARNASGDSSYSTAGAAVTTRSAPTISWVSPPASAVPAGISLQVSATATDADDGALSVALEESTDGGDTWDPIGNSPQVRTVSGDTRWRATATDADEDQAQSTRVVTVGEAVAAGRPGINRGLITTR